ncbi:hypothetical protein RB3559 [Rhodopirellula baltica SH 1]|uniref:Uncharacterized protein n=1 Tax=Rhodopirellula baltica (strain DSM 10527 / NCIMB 13988 / SH1) TaxID=243090 RepID=Q7UU23_RHOBA|nr:hypothetical protein RB3559 [Rhodopirellula baltica SH 1]
MLIPQSRNSNAGQTAELLLKTKTEVAQACSSVAGDTHATDSLILGVAIRRMRSKVWERLFDGYRRRIELHHIDHKFCTNVRGHDS